MAFDPTTLFPGSAGDREGAILKIRPENLSQDEAGTTAVTQDGDPVRRIDDISVNGRDFITFDVNHPMTYHTDGTVHWLTSDATDDIGLQGVDAWPFMNENPYTAAFAVSFATPGSGDQYFFCTDWDTSAGTARDGTVHIGARSGTQVTIGHWFNDANFSYSTPTDTPERHIAEFTNPGSEYTVDGTSVGTSSDPTSLGENGLVDTVHIFTRPESDLFMAGNFYGAIIIIDTISAQEKADIDEWLQEQAEGPSEQTIEVGKATETDAANAVNAVKTAAVGQATETDTANAVNAVKTELVLQATEEDIARPVAPLRTLTVGQAAETDTANAVTATRAVSVGKATETDTANAVGRLRVLSVGQASSTEAARPVTPRRTLLTGQATETDAANAVGHSKQVTIGIARETDTAKSVTVAGGVEPEPSGGLWLLRRRRRWI